MPIHFNESDKLPEVIKGTLITPDQSLSDAALKKSQANGKDIQIIQVLSYVFFNSKPADLKKKQNK